MVENRPLLTLFAHIALMLGVATVLLPVWIAFVASTHEGSTLLGQIVPMWPGDRFAENYGTALSSGVEMAAMPPVSMMMWNSLIMALAITIGKIAISLLSAFAIVYFKFPFRALAFLTIFLTLMPPVGVRHPPTC